MLCFLSYKRVMYIQIKVNQNLQNTQNDMRAFTYVDATLIIKTCWNVVYCSNCIRISSWSWKRFKRFRL